MIDNFHWSHLGHEALRIIEYLTQMKSHYLYVK